MKTGVARDKTRDVERKMKTLQMIFMKVTQEEHICAVLVHNLSYLCSQHLLQIGGGGVKKKAGPPPTSTALNLIFVIYIYHSLTS